MYKGTPYISENSFKIGPAAPENTMVVTFVKDNRAHRVYTGYIVNTEKVQTLEVLILVVLYFFVMYKTSTERDLITMSLSIAAVLTWVVELIRLTIDDDMTEFNFLLALF